VSAADNADNVPANPVAVLLERAATGIREHAEAATPGPWEATGTDVLSRSADRHWAGACAANAADGDGQHIASWHPLVALAVADWLEAEAAVAGPGGAVILMKTVVEHPRRFWCRRCERELYLKEGACRCWNGAVAVARTWLGETGEGQ
jgi:hypothetical protein